ncbi:MAG: hypothetical protein VYD19_06530 [Myxococcota bacterium]|nr:hypothetical protein [Myxococcota bacterium]
MRRTLSWSLSTIIVLASGCLSREENFTQGRLKATCTETTPICSGRATCTLSPTRYLEGVFPGAEKAVLYIQHPRSRVKMRVLLSEQVYPGTEFLARIHDLGCADAEEVQLLEVDIFRRAGDDRVLDFSFDVDGRGDHLVELFSDMSARYTVTVDIERRGD